MRAVSENVVRAPMATVDLWRSIESLASENWTERGHRLRPRHSRAADP